MYNNFLRQKIDTNKVECFFRMEILEVIKWPHLNDRRFLNLGFWKLQIFIAEYFNLSQDEKVSEVKFKYC